MSSTVTTHHIQVSIDYFDAVLIEYVKTRVCYRDRHYKVGNTLVIEEGKYKNYSYDLTGRTINAVITKVESDPANHRMVVLTFEIDKTSLKEYESESKTAGK